MLPVLLPVGKQVFNKLAEPCRHARFILIALTLLVIGGEGWALNRSDPRGKNLSSILRNLPTEAYSFYPSGGSIEEEMEAKNPAQNLVLNYSNDRLNIYSSNALWRLQMRLLGFEQGAEKLDFAKTDSRLEANGNRLENRRGNLTEWYVNDSHGLEQGFDLAAPLSLTSKSKFSKGSNSEIETLKVKMAIQTDLIPTMDEVGSEVIFKDQNNRTIYRYDHLYVFDSEGKELPSHFELISKGIGRKTNLNILIDDSQAVYPITIDPLLTNQPAKVIASDGAVDDNFGFAVALSGNTAVVGTDIEANTAGAAYVFERDFDPSNPSVPLLDNWGQVTILLPSDGVAGDNFGSSVAIDGDTIVVGTFTSTSPGAAYVFERDSGGLDNWGQVEKLVGSDTNNGDIFGFSVGISVDTIAVSSPLGDGPAAGDQAGALYIFERDINDITIWTETVRTFSPDEGTLGLLISSMALNGDIVVVGAPFTQRINSQNGVVYVFSRDQGGADNWGQVTAIVAEDADSQPVASSIGDSVDVDGDTIIVGASGNDSSGAAYIFGRNEGGTDHWGQITKLNPADPAPAALFGSSVSVSGDTVAVGAIEESGLDNGSVYIYQRNEDGVDQWGQSAKLRADDGQADDRFGISVAVDGNTIVSGADGDDDNGAESGSAYVFDISGATGVVDNVMVLEDAVNSVLNLNTAFDALVGDPTNLTYTVFADSVPGIVSPVVNNTTDELTLGFIPNQFGFTNITVRGEDSSNVITEATFLVSVESVNDTPVANPDATSVNEGGMVNNLDGGIVNLLDNDTDVDIPPDSLTLSTTPVSGPGFGTLTLSSSGTFTYTHNGDEVFSDSFVYEISDLEGATAIATVSITIDPVNDNTPVATPDFTSVGEGTTVTSLDGGISSVLANDTDIDLPHDTLTVSVTPVSGPFFAGSFTLNPDGTFSYTHNDSENLTDSFVYEVSDAEGATATALVSIDIKPINDNSPVADDDAISVLEDDFAATLVGGIDNLLANDDDLDLPNDTLTVSITPVSGPSFGSVSLDPGGTFLYTHNGDEEFTDNFVYEVLDEEGASDTALVSISITPVNDNPPMAGDDFATISEGGIATTVNGGVTSLLANDMDFDLPKDTLQLIGLTGSGGGVPIPILPEFGDLTFDTDGTFTYQHDGSENFTDSFAYVVSDGVFTDFGTVTISITPENENAPQAGNDSIFVTEGGMATELAGGANSLLANDTDEDLPIDLLTVNTTPVSEPGFGVLTLIPDGTFIYSHDGDEVFTDSFIYEVKDENGAIDTALVTITIDPLSDAPPVANDDSATVLEGAPVSLLDNGATSVLDNDVDGDIPSDPLIVTTIGTFATANGSSVTMSSDGTFLYQHDDSSPEGLSDSFDYEITDGIFTATATVSITIEPVNDNAPVAGDDFSTISEGGIATTVNGGVTSLLANDMDLDLPKETLLLTGLVGSGGGVPIPILPEFGDLTFDTDGTFTYQHDGSENFTDSFAYVVSDGVFTDSGTVSISINPQNDQPTTVGSGLPNVEVEENSADTVINLDTFFDDAEDGPAGLTYTVEGNTAPGLFTTDPVLISSGTLTLVYAPNFPGTADITIRATDSGTLFVESTFTVTINEAVNSIENWRSLFFGTDVNFPAKEATVWGDLANPDGDNLSNLVEYFMGLNPTLNDEAGKITVEVIGNTILVTYQRALATPDAVGGVEWSEDLVTWVTTDINPVVTSSDMETETIEATITLTGSETAIFIRLKVERL